MNALSIESVDPSGLSPKDFSEVNEVIQDLWASEAGLGECRYCKDCWHFSSKEEIFGESSTVKQMTVAEICRILNVNHLSCKSCWWDNVIWCYGEENEVSFKKKMFQSRASFLVLAKDDTRIVGVGEAYIASLEEIYARDLEFHYQQIGLDIIRKRVTSLLGYCPSEFLTISSVWLLEPYRNFQNLFAILQKLSHKFPNDYRGLPGVAEFRSNWVISKVSDHLSNGKLLWITEDASLRKKITSNGRFFDSEIMLYDDPVGTHKDCFWGTLKSFLRRTRPVSTNNIPVCI